MRPIHIFGVFALSCMVAAAQGPTESQAKALVKQALAYAKQYGMQKLVQATNQANGKFHVAADGAPFIFIYDQTGICKAAGSRMEQYVGKNRTGLQDAEGKFIVLEIVKTAKVYGNCWVDYKVRNPGNGKLEAKTSYVELFDDLIITAEGADDHTEPDHKPPFDDDGCI